jgi:hypothetical protein
MGCAENSNGSDKGMALGVVAAISAEGDAEGRNRKRPLGDKK